MKKVSLENAEANPSSVNWDLPRNTENVMEQDATRCTCITCKKPTCGTCSAGISQIIYVICKGCSIPTYEAFRFGKQEKRLAALFPNFSKCALCWWYLCDLHYHAKTISTISRYLHNCNVYNYVNSCLCLTTSRWLNSMSWLAVRNSLICSIIWYIGIRAVASGGGSGARLPHLKSVPPHFTFGPPVAAYIQYCILRMCPPSGSLPLHLVFGPPAAKSWRRAWLECILCQLQ